MRRLEGGHPGSIESLRFRGKYGRREQALSEALRSGYIESTPEKWPAVQVCRDRGWN